MICSDISKLIYVISRAVRRVKFETILKYNEWYLCTISRTDHAIICLYRYPQKVNFVIFTSRYFKLSWNTTALSQSNCRNFSCSSIMCESKEKLTWLDLFILAATPPSSTLDTEFQRALLTHIYAHNLHSDSDNHNWSPRSAASHLNLWQQQTLQSKK